MKARHLLGIPVAGMALLCAAAQERRPNIIVIMTDQQRADLCGREGFPLDLTPFADSLARRGVWFDRAYTTAPASAPARTSMLTGRFPKSTRVRSNHNIADVCCEADLFSVASARGYRTAMVGKNHTYLTADSVDFWCPYDHTGRMPSGRSDAERRFDEYLKSTAYYANLEGPAPFGPEMQLPWRIVSDATEWIREQGDAPFVMWLSFPEPHNPYQVCEPYSSMFPPGSLPPARTDRGALRRLDERYRQLDRMMSQGHTGYGENLDKLRANYMGMIRLIDDQVRRLCDSLVRTGTADNTVLVLLSDHGDYAGEYGLMKKGVGLSDAIARIPLIWWGGPVAASGRSDACVSIADLFPTCCEIMGAEIPRGVQGRSLLPMLLGEEYPASEFASIMAECGYGGQYYTDADGTDYRAEGALSNRKYFFDELNSWTQSGSQRMLRKGSWKLVFDMLGHGELYNLDEDPSEIRNLYDRAQYAKIRSELTAELLKWEIATQDPLPMPRRRYFFRRNAHNYLFCDPRKEIVAD